MKSSSTQVFHHIIGDLFTSLEQDMRFCFDFANNIWFWKQMAKSELIKYLEFAVDTTLVKTAQSLLYAYTYPGTMEGLIQLSHGLFGQDSIIIVDDIEAATLGIKIKNANTNFLYTLIDSQNNTIMDSQDYHGFCLALNDLAMAVSYNAKGFFQQFLTPGRILKKLNIAAIT